MDHTANDRPNVVAFPPLIYAAALRLSLVARFWLQLPIAPRWLARPRRKAGITLIAAGAATAIWGARTFEQAGTNISVHEPATALVERGPYQYTRNPIYVGLIAIYSGISLLINNLWGVLLLPGLLTVVQRGVVEREEEYLRARFGDTYDAFTESIPRWL